MTIARMVLHPVHSPGLAQALADLPAVEVVCPPDDDGVVEALHHPDSILLTYRWDDRFLVDGLVWLQAISAGMDQFPLDELSRQQVLVTSARGAHTPAVAEHALALTLALLRGIGPAVRGAPERRWRGVSSTEIAGLTIAVLGIGSIGEEYARKVVALGARVVGVKQNLESYAGCADIVTGPDRLDHVLSQADVAVSFLPGSPSTRGLMGRGQFAALGGWFVNVGRGDTVDQDALVEALLSGGLEGAALDVTDPEPLSDDSPLWDMEGVIITPHMAWMTPHLTPRLVDVIHRNLDARRDGREPPTRVT